MPISAAPLKTLVISFGVPSAPGECPRCSIESGELLLEQVGTTARIRVTPRSAEGRGNLERELHAACNQLGDHRCGAARTRATRFNFVRWRTVLRICRCDAVRHSFSIVPDERL
jgi:hypothetical protein